MKMMVDSWSHEMILCCCGASWWPKGVGAEGSFRAFRRAALVEAEVVHHHNLLTRLGSNQSFLL